MEFTRFLYNLSELYLMKDGKQQMLISAGISNHDADFTFERNGGFPFWTFAFYHKGECFIKSGGEEIKGCPYDLKCIRPNTPYSTRIVPNFSSWHGDWIIAELRPGWEGLICGVEELKGIYSLNVAGFAEQEKIKESFRNAVNLMLMPEPFADLSAMHALEEVLLLSYHINRMQTQPKDERIRKAIEILSNNFEKKIDVDTVAKKIGMSASRFAHLFKEEIGETPMSFRESIRLERAKQLIFSTNMSIKQIATTLAYDCSFHFSKRFKSRIGVSPQKYRMQTTKTN